MLYTPSWQSKKAISFNEWSLYPTRVLKKKINLHLDVPDDGGAVGVGAAPPPPIMFIIIAIGFACGGAAPPPPPPPD